MLEICAYLEAGECGWYGPNFVFLIIPRSERLWKCFGSQKEFYIESSVILKGKTVGGAIKVSQSRSRNHLRDGETHRTCQLYH